MSLINETCSLLRPVLTCTIGGPIIRTSLYNIRNSVSIFILLLLSITGPTYNEDGDIVISENEFLEIKRLKELKQNYRNDFDELKNLKAEVQYCQRLVDQCRQRLIQGM